MRNWQRHLLIGILGGLLLGCSQPDQSGPAVQGSVANPSIDSEAALTALIEADSRFLDASQSAGMAEAYRRFMAPEALQMLNGYPPIEGRDNIYANFADFADQNANASLSWELEGADVAASGDLGYTWGTYFYIGPDEVGEEDLIEGNYVNIWRKSAAGNWEVIVDIENRTLLTEDSFSDDENADALMFDEGLVDEIGAGAN